MTSVNLLDVHAQRIVGIPGWAPYRYQALDGPQKASLLEGAVAPLLTRGKHKGLPNWRKMDADTKRTIVITVADHETFLAAWELETGKCAACAGAGQRLVRWSHDTGAEYGPCPKCSGSGERTAPT